MSHPSGAPRRADLVTWPSGLPAAVIPQYLFQAVGGIDARGFPETSKAKSRFRDRRLSASCLRVDKSVRARFALCSNGSAPRSLRSTRFGRPGISLEWMTAEPRARLHSRRLWAHGAPMSLATGPNDHPPRRVPPWVATERLITRSCVTPKPRCGPQAVDEYLSRPRRTSTDCDRCRARQTSYRASSALCPKPWPRG